MAILGFQLDSVGEAGVKPRLIRIQTNDTLTTITTANYLLPLQRLGLAFDPSDIALVSYVVNGATVAEAFGVSVSGGNVTLNAGAGDVTLPVASNNFVMFDGTSGQIKDSGYSPSDPTSNSVVMTNRGVIIGNLPNFSTVNGALSDTQTPVRILMHSAFDFPDINANLVRFDVTVNASDLNGGAKTLIPSSTSKSYIITNIQLNATGGLSGGSGNRNATMIDSGSNIFTSIPAASLQTPTNAAWGSTAVPFPTTIPANQATVAGSSLIMTYSGGTTNYTTGSVVVSVTAIRVA